MLSGGIGFMLHIQELNIQLMRNNLTFRLSAQNSLRINEVVGSKEANLLNTFKAGSDLRGQLNKSKMPNKSMKVGKTSQTFMKQQLKSEDEALKQEVAALDHFKAPVTKEKTKNMIENIKLRRREKHIDTLSRFHEDLDDYKENLYSIYSSLYSDIEQVMSIKEGAVEEYLKSCEDQKYLLSREKDLLSEIREQINSYRIECETKLNYSKQELERIKDSRGTVVADTCLNLRHALTEIAFVLEKEAAAISEEEKEQIEKLQNKFYEEYSGKMNSELERQKERNERVEGRGAQVIKKWKQVKEEYQLKTYLTDAEADSLRRPESLRHLYDELISCQNQNHELKVKLMRNLIQQNPDTFSQANLDKFNAQLKKLNDKFDEQLDNLLNLFLTAKNAHKDHNENRFNHCKKRLNYIENHTEQEVEEIMEEKCAGTCRRNIREQEELMKKATGYVETHDDKENQVLAAFSSFILKIGKENDSFIKEFQKLNQQYEIEKAKILDDDEELVEKLNEELNNLKVELREALHHIKLDEVEKKAFQKVDEIESAYRQCHEKNKELKSTRTPSIEQFMMKYEAKLAEIMQLYDPSRRAELEEKNKQEAEEEAMRRIEAEEKKKAEEEARLIEEAKAKGGKPPPPAKPKDPKKAAAEQEERKKAILAEMGTKSIEELQSDTGAKWLVFRSIQEIVKTFYQLKQKEDNEKEDNEKEKEGATGEEGNTGKGEEEQQKKVKALDDPDGEIKDCRGESVVTQKAFLRIKDLVPQITSLRQKLFDSVAEKKKRIVVESEECDQEMLDESLTNLDQRLKAHYSLKGTIESEIYVKRSGEIGSHKKKYEKYARTIKDKMDLQTEKFNFLLEKGLEKLKEHNTEQKKMKEFIPKCKNLSELQGMYTRTRENFNSFGLTLKQMYSQLDRLSSYEIDILLEKNETFIKDSRSMEEGGEYSNQELQWYKEMMGQITKQMKEQQEKRKEKLEELKNHSEKRRKELLEAFEKQYHLAIEETSAKDGTGKKYGRPKRIAQEKTRLEMNKCEQAQINIDKMISELGKEYQSHMNKGFQFNEQPPTLEWRKKLMTIQTCIMRYGKHIQAFKGDLIIEPMERVNYDEQQSTCKLGADEEEKDKGRKEDQLKSLGRLYEQKDDRVFMKYIEDIEKVISDESRSIYVGEKAKYLTGNDKIPDFLRLYIGNMKSNANSFRISSIRELRQSCVKLANLSSCISEFIFTSIMNYCLHKQTEVNRNCVSDLKEFFGHHKDQRAEHLKKLRPNLVNPKCQGDLKQLDDEEKKRSSEFMEMLEKKSKEFKDNLFSNADGFLNNIFNNFEFLMGLTNSFYLYEDFVKLPGDQIEEKNHLDIQRLMVMKQKGIKIDPSSERNLKRKWEGIDFTVFDIEERKYVYKKIAAEEQVKEKDKKGGKKDSKDPKKQEEAVEADPTKSKMMETFKTWRQKSVFENRNKAYESFKGIYKNIVEDVASKIEAERKENERFGIKWRETADSLYIK